MKVITGMTANNSLKKYKIALTGGIASGKSTVSEIIEKLGYEVYSADKIYAELLEDEKFALDCSALLGIDPLYVDGNATFDRKTASKIVYGDEAIRKAFDEYTHKFVYDKIDEIFTKAKGRIVFFEIPLLFESGRQNDFDYVVVVMRDKTERVKSVVSRDGKTEDLAEKIISVQFDYDNIDDIRHTIIYNDGDLVSLSEKVNSTVEYLEKTLP